MENLNDNNDKLIYDENPEPESEPDPDPEPEPESDIDIDNNLNEEDTLKRNKSSQVQAEQTINSENKKNKSIEGSRIQKQKYCQWYEEDKKFLKTKTSIKDLEKFECGDFEIVEINNERNLKQSTSWLEIKSKSNNQDNNNSNMQDNVIQNKDKDKNMHSNIILKNKIIKMNDSIFNLRSLGVEAELNFLMAGESCFYIFSRGSNQFSNNMAVCYINKDLDTNRKFINFAILEDNELDQSYFILKTLKKQEIPKQENYIKNLDICEVNLTFVDNGDNKCYILIETDSKKILFFLADFYLPTSQYSNLMFAASGDLISLRSLNIKQVCRNSKLNLKDEDESNSKQSCNCCIIF